MQFELMTMHFIDTFFFFFNDTATTEIYTLSLHDALPIFGERRAHGVKRRVEPLHDVGRGTGLGDVAIELERDRKSTRLNSSHSQISYAVFCLKKKKKKQLRHMFDQEYTSLRSTARLYHTY